MQKDNLIILLLMALPVVVGFGWFIYPHLAAAIGIGQDDTLQEGEYSYTVGNLQFQLHSPVEDLQDVPIRPSTSQVAEASLTDNDFYFIGVPSDCGERETCAILQGAAFDTSGRMIRLYQQLGYSDMRTFEEQTENLTGGGAFLTGEPEDFDEVEGIRIVIRQSDETQVFMQGDDIVIIEGPDKEEIRRASDAFGVLLLENYERYALRGML